jgi:hypothetical protein
MKNSKWQKFEDPDVHGSSYCPYWDQLLDTAGRAGLRTALMRSGNLLVKTTRSLHPGAPSPTDSDKQGKGEESEAADGSSC